MKNSMTMTMTKTYYFSCIMVGKICIIGSGPSGMALLCWFAKLKREGRVIPEIVCYEKQSSFGGLWNYSWRTGTDESGESVHGSMYRSGRQLVYRCTGGCLKRCTGVQVYRFRAITV